MKLVDKQDSHGSKSGITAFIMNENGPLNPDDYDVLSDPVHDELRKYVRRASTINDPKEHHALLRRLLPRVPINTLQAHLQEEQGADQVAEVLSAYVRAQVERYLADLGADPKDFPTFSGKTDLHFSMQWCGDELTGRHLANTAILTGLTTDLLMGMQQGEVNQELRRMNVLAGATHDFGKAMFPQVVLETPVPRMLMGAVYGWDLGDPKRKRPVKSPIPLAEAERIYFTDLLNGDSFDPDRVHEFGLLCKQRKGDYLGSIPIRTFIKLAEHVLSRGALPATIQSYVDEFLSPEDSAAVKHMIATLQSQRDLITDANWAIARAGLDGFQTLAEVIAGHEFESFRMAPPCVAGLVARHHNYPQTRRRIEATGRVVPVPSETAVHALIMADVISALSEHRPYFSDGAPKPLPVIRKIVAQEAKRHQIPEETVLMITDKLLAGEEEKDPLKRIIENGRKI